MVLSELLALCDNGNAMITIVREDGQQLEYGKAYGLFGAAIIRFMM